ncbi:hypothetical protein [Intrasporangium sp. YIM S08009]|uniref:hypothetical protein n=1 Tax=Intrasporangium zincisolvens TaxID=3080018 RepID=UPI002B0558CC|nr:hypothetical protein [Intrasporangium sp. YIM S08009]
MSRRSEPRTLDLETLPADVRTVLEAMLLGEEATLVRGHRELGVLSFRSTVLEGTLLSDPQITSWRPRPVPEGVTVVATAMRLSPAARQRLSDDFGADYVVLDFHEAPDTTDVLLIHPVSPQLLGRLRSRFPQARVVVAEIDDEELGVSCTGPVSRLLDAGASAYLPPRPVGAVAAMVQDVLRGDDVIQLTAADRTARTIGTD